MQFNTSIPVIINILDFNDNSPVFNHSLYQFNLTEGNYTDALVIGSIGASDADDTTSDNGKLMYSLDSNISPIFTIDPNSGKIYTVVLFFENYIEFMIFALSLDT